MRRVTAGWSGNPPCGAGTQRQEARELLQLALADAEKLRIPEAKRIAEILAGLEGSG